MRQTKLNTNEHKRTRELKQAVAYEIRDTLRLINITILSPDEILLLFMRLRNIWNKTRNVQTLRSLSVFYAGHLCELYGQVRCVFVFQYSFYVTRIGQD